MGLAPLLAYRLHVGHAPAVSAQQAVAILEDSGQSAVLVDVRPYAQYAAGRAQGAMNLPAENLGRVKSLEQLPQMVRERKLVLVDVSGWDSAGAAKDLQRLGKQEVVWVKGGMAGWHASGGKELKFVGAGGTTRPAGLFHATSGWAQLWLGLSWLILKPLYVFLALVVAWRLRKATSGDVVAVKWACGLLAGAQVAGAIAGRSIFMEYLHMYGVVLAAAAALYAVMRMIDLRIVRPDESGFCPMCVEHFAGSSCAVRRVLRLLVVVLGVLAVMPLTTAVNETAYATGLFDKTHVFLREGVYQAYEIRFLPGAAIVFLIWAWWRLRRKGHPARNTQIIVAGAMAAIGFAWVRCGLLAAFENDQAWVDVWQQVMGLGFVLVVIRVMRTFGGVQRAVEVGNG